MAKTQAPKAAPATQAPKAAKQAPKAAKPQAAAPAPVDPAPVAPAPVVALRGGLVLGQVTLSGKLYRVAAAHNAAWWNTTRQVLEAAGGAAPVQAIVQAGVPASMVGYLYRRGYLAQVA